MTILNPNLSSPAFKADPFPFYARLRNESPVHPVTLPGKHRAWLITRYDDVVAALRDPRLGKDPLNALSAEQTKKMAWMPAMFRPLTRNMLDLNPPDHTRLRALVQKAFTPRLIEDLRGGIAEIAVQLLAVVKKKRRMDVIRDFALPLPTIVLAEMLGVPVEDRGKFHRWSAGIVAANWSRWSTIRAVPNVIAFIRYIRKLTTLLRYGSPLETATERFAAEDVVMHDITIPRGEMVFAVLASANRDERQFVNPDVFDLARDPNRHVSFGLGIHYCLGSPLARIEGQIAFEAMLRELPTLRLAFPEKITALAARSRPARAGVAADHVVAHTLPR
jgi:cytochrome P450 PksS